MVVDTDHHLAGGDLDDDLDRSLAPAVADGVVEQVPDDVGDHLLVGAVGRRVAGSEQGDLDPGMPGDLALDRGADQAPDGDRLADRVDPVAFGVHEDDEVLDQAIEPVRLDADVLGQRAPAVSLELALGQELGAAIDRRHRRSELVRQDVEERLAIGLVDQPALRRARGGIGSRAVRMLWQEQLGLEPSDLAASCPNGRL